MIVCCPKLDCYISTFLLKFVYLPFLWNKNAIVFIFSPNSPKNVDNTFSDNGLFSELNLLSWFFCEIVLGGDSQRSNSVTRVPPLYTFLSLKYTLMSLFIPLSVGIMCSGGTFGKWRKTNRTYPSMFTSTSLYSAVLSPWARVIAVSVYRRHSKWTGPTESIPVLY